MTGSRSTPVATPTSFRDGRGIDHPAGRPARCRRGVGVCGVPQRSRRGLLPGLAREALQPGDCARLHEAGPRPVLRARYVRGTRRENHRDGHVLHGRPAPTSSLTPLREAEGYRAVRAAIIAAAFAPIFRVLDTLKDGDSYLQAIAVDPDLRGAGVGSLLMDRVEDLGRASGSRRLCLDVSGSNGGARRLYERLGMNVVSESKIFYMPGVRLLRMAKAI